MKSRFFLLASLTILLVSCGGGGGGGGGGGSSSSPSSPSSPSSSIPSTNSFSFTDLSSNSNLIVSTSEADVFRTTEYNRQWGLEAIHAAEGYALLNKNSLTQAGNGVAIAIVDSGADVSHPDLQANVVVADSYNYVASSTDVNDTSGHGTAVASIAAGVKGNGSSTIHGVAYNSDIVVSKALAGTVGDAMNAIEGSSGKDNVKVINGSFGYGSYSSYNGATSDASLLDAAFISNLTTYVKNNDILFVAAAGNDGDNYNDGQSSDSDAAYLTNPKPTKPALFAANSDLAGYVLAVGAVDSDGRIADFSNICGIAKNYCLVAPGVSGAGAYQDDDGINYISTGISGTSFASPMVSGAAATIRAAWPALTAPQTAQILLLSATDFGDAGVDEIYGHGMLNLYGALQYYGDDVIPAGLSATSFSGELASSSSFASDPIFGDAFESRVSSALSGAIFLDYFGRDYHANLNQKIGYKQQRRAIAFDANNILLSEYEKVSAPFSFASPSGLKTSMNFSFQKRSNNFLDFITRDNSVLDQQIQQNRGFSFAQNDRNFAYGFGLNSSPNLSFQNDLLQKFGGFLSLNSLNTNPFASFAQSSSSRVNITQNQNNFSQFFINKNLFEQKLRFGFLSQTMRANSADLSLNGAKQNQINDFNFSYQPSEKTNLFASFGRLNEFDNNVLNSKALGAFAASDDTKTSYFKFSLAQKIFAEIFAVGNFSLAQTSIQGNENGVFRNFSSIKSRALAFGFINANFFGGRFGALYNEPMRVYQGQVEVNVPVARDVAGNIYRKSEIASLKPFGKERNLEFFYEGNVTDEASLALNFLMIKDAFNVKRDGLDYLGMASYKVRW